MFEPCIKTCFQRGFGFLLFTKKISFIKQKRKNRKGKEFRRSNQIIKLVKKIEEV